MPEPSPDPATTLQACLAAVDELSREVALLREQLLALQRVGAPSRVPAGPGPPAAAPGESPARQGAPVADPGAALAAQGPGTLAPASPSVAAAAPMAALRSSRAVWPAPGGSAAGAAPGRLHAEAPGYQPVAPRPGYLQRTPVTLEQWVRLFDAKALPVLGRTAQALERGRGDEDRVDLHTLGELIRGDPLMTLKVFAHGAAARGTHPGSGPEDVTGALVMLGVAPFFRAFGPQGTVEQLLAPWPEAQAGFDSVMARSERAARFALAFAVQRMDQDAALVHSAALLHDFAELLVWFTAPHLALEMRRRQRARPGLRSADVQMMLLNVRLVDLHRALSHHWHLPARLLAITDAHRNPNSLQVRTVQLAVRVARHSAQGWADPALPDDVAEISRLLNLSPEPTLKLLRSIDEG